MDEVGAGVYAGTELGVGTMVGEGLELTSLVEDEDGIGWAWLFFIGRVPFLIIRRAWVTSRADSCCPTPEAPSQPPVYHLLPHVTPSGPPEQDLAAPRADALRYFVMVSLVNGAMSAVFAMKRER